MTKCKNCNQEVKAKDKRTVFCSKSCAASFNNKGVRRHKGESKSHCSCGKKMSFGSKQCSDCNSKNIWHTKMNKTLKEVTYEGNARIKWSEVRRNAGQVLEKENIPKQCRFCDYPYVDVCHIKPISKFSEEALLKEVNSPTNLIYLCPNHHKLLDKQELEI